MSKRPMTICYHGTDEACAKSILVDGFELGTYFAKNLADSIGFGGEWVFEVMFYQDEIENVDWQFSTPTAIRPDRIVTLKSYSIIEIQHDEELRKDIFESHED